MAIGERVAIDLAADLQRVAAIDEDRRPVGEHDGEPGRAREAGQPVQPLGIGGDVFALMLVAARAQEARETAAVQFRAQPGEAAGIPAGQAMIFWHV